MSRVTKQAFIIPFLTCICISTTAALGRPTQVPPVGPDTLERRCEYEGGDFQMGRDGSYRCRFPDGTTVSCNPDRICIRYRTLPGSGRGSEILIEPNGNVLLQ